jgi:ribosomal protein S18 acetylase RimI-like enzyme
MPTADALPADALVDLFNRAYSDYFLPVAIDLDGLGLLTEVMDVDLAASPLVEHGGVPVGFALLGARGGRGWIGGMGVVPEARRHGLGRAAMTAVLDAARARGVREVQLEVLEQNEPAIALYRQLGFEHVRDLDVWSLGEVAPGSNEATPVDVDDAHAWIVRHRPSAEPWQRADETLAHVRGREPQPLALELRREGERAGAAVSVVRAGTASVLQLAVAAGEPQASAEALIAAVRMRGDALRWLNAPAGEPGSAAMAALGATLVARQHELVLPLEAA